MCLCVDMRILCMGVGGHDGGVSWVLVKMYTYGVMLT